MKSLRQFSPNLKVGKAETTGLYIKNDFDIDTGDLLDIESCSICSFAQFAILDSNRKLGCPNDMPM
jgi:hypothetical protein